MLSSRFTAPATCTSFRVGSASFAVNFDGKDCGVCSVLPFTLSQGVLNWHRFLEGPEGVENARFGSAIAALSDVNMDGLNDVIVGAPLENHNSGAVYIYNGHKRTVRTKCSQVRRAFCGPVFTHGYRGHARATRNGAPPLPSPFPSYSFTP